MPAIKPKPKTANPMKALRARLSDAGVKKGFLDKVVLPSWWEDSLAETTGGFREAAAYICAHLGYGLACLLDGRAKLEFSQQGAVKFKKAKGVSEDDVCLTTHYALGVARAVAGGFSEHVAVHAVPAPEAWREALLAKAATQWVTLKDILQATWKLGIPVVHVRNIPAGAKKPDALTTMVGDRPVIVVMNGRKSPSWVAFIVAHELGHIHHKHLKAGQTLVDEKIGEKSDEKDEGDANDFAAKLLTGSSDLGLSSPRSMGIPQLAAAAKSFGGKYRVSPGVAALNYASNTGEWAVANGAVAALEANEDAAEDMNAALLENVGTDDFSEDAWEWICRATSGVK